MRHITGLFVIVFIFVLGCESEKIEYHCNIPLEDVPLYDDLVDVWDTGTIDAMRFRSNINQEDISLFDSGAYDVDHSDAGVGDTNMDVLSGKSCTTIGISKECGTGESCYPFVECGGLCRRCGTSPAGSNCDIHSDCKCGMACLALQGGELRCYKICSSNLDCPSGKTCTDAWSPYYEHEYYKICKAAALSVKEEK